MISQNVQFFKIFKITRIKVINIGANFNFFKSTELFFAQLSTMPIMEALFKKALKQLLDLSCAWFDLLPLEFFQVQTGSLFMPSGNFKNFIF